MRHKYETHGIVLSRSPLGEANAFITFLTSELGIVRVRVQGVRMSGAKLASALTTLTEGSLVLVHGREGWRLVGAILEENWFQRLQCATSRQRAGRVCSLLLRLVTGEAHDTSLFPILRGYFEALRTLPKEMHEAAEMLADLRILAALGFDEGDIPAEIPLFNTQLLTAYAMNRTNYIARINRGITASGL